ncbi:MULTISPECIES: hypothetical protein [Rhodococcus]|uniref:Uncharacterized protein n=1 Tax=Rhodococcus qingshengii JCM 15477 TaxID=1303681 RepID=A0AB38RPQ5_RHOSG|nr:MULTISPECIES: hypothetical protein [Rhodococcus]MDA3635330.1 hypothetical protein [Rhodococcus sp. C-2]UPU46769.1 hypothetical protein M0639_31700 [Rhodococcus qingshengii JCM 15477]
MDWFVSVWDEGMGVHVYRGGEGFDRASVIDQVLAAGRVIVRRQDDSVIGTVGKVVIDGIPVDAIPFGDNGIGDDELRWLIGAQFDRVRAGIDAAHTASRPRQSDPPRI